MLAASLCFACMGAAIHWLGGHLHWSVVSFFRMFLSALLLIAVAKARGIPILVRGVPAMWVRALAGSLGMIGNFYALTVLPVSDATAIYHTMPVWVALIRWAVYKESLSPVQWVCVAGAVVGVFITEESMPDALNWGLAAGLGGAFFYAIASIGMSFLGGHHPQSVTIHFSLVASGVALACVAISLPGREEIVPASAAIGAGLLVPAVLGSVAQVLMAGALGRGHNVTVALVGLSQVIFAGFFDVFLWDRAFTATKITGIAVILVSVGGMAAGRIRRGRTA
jgi:drug/metabolite transporter (DMT)-like permease